MSSINGKWTAWVKVGTGGPWNQLGSGPDEATCEVFIGEYLHSRKGHDALTTADVYFSTLPPGHLPLRCPLCCCGGGTLRMAPCTAPKEKVMELNYRDGPPNRDG